ncbi:MAG: sigma-70 family RNA polymerase sigma factor [Proteobacteria bacterium]|nr:sigma-70 family RNA polymerase sigma factor [Pseudomonadota bacterium]
MKSSKEELFVRIMQTHQGLLGRIIESYAPPGPDRDDLSQEVGLAIWKSLSSFRGDSSQRTFVARIAHNRGLGFVYKRRLNKHEMETEVHDKRPGPEDVADVSQRRRALFSAIRSMPVGYRQVLTLALEEIPHREIAEVMGISVGNVDVRLTRARAMLKEKLEERNG